MEAVREGLVVAFVRWLCRTARGFADGPAERGAPAAPPALLLLLTRLCLDYEATTISYILTLTDEQFPPQVSPQDCPSWPQNGPKGTLNVSKMSQNAFVPASIQDTAVGAMVCMEAWGSSFCLRPPKHP